MFPYDYWKAQSSYKQNLSESPGFHHRDSSPRIMSHWVPKFRWLLLGVNRRVQLLILLELLFDSRHLLSAQMAINLLGVSGGRITSSESWRSWASSSEDQDASRAHFWSSIEVDWSLNRFEPWILQSSLWIMGYIISWWQQRNPLKILTNFFFKKELSKNIRKNP